jgi:cobaltochelatase CobS
MTKAEQLSQELSDLNQVIYNSSTPPNLVQRAKEQFAIKRLELDQLEAAQQAASEQIESTAPIQQIIPQGDAVTEALSIIRTMMLAAPSGSGVSSDAVNKMIEDYLVSKKISLLQLDKKVLEYIKENQMVTITVPSVGLNVEVSSQDAKIPNLFTILDDVFAGNNIYLIGEAGGGKTYAAERVAAILKRELMMINCSQYTSPTEIIGGQTIEGYKEGKLIRAWRDGKVLILDEMPRLDPNTAGLFNDALAKSSHTRPAASAKINSSNPEEPPFPRNDNFALIGTGNVYPNTPPSQQYAANNQQDLSLLDRFSGSVYFTEYNKAIDDDMCRYKFIYDMLVGNYYEYNAALKNNQTPPVAQGLRTVLKDLQHTDKAVVSYRTCIAFRVAFEIELVRAMYYRENPDAPKINGKTIVKAFESFMVAFSPDVKNSIMNVTGLTSEKIQLEADNVIRMFTEGSSKDWMKTLLPSVRDNAEEILKKTKEIQLADSITIS